jgi:hypothetical protein
LYANDQPVGPFTKKTKKLEKPITGPTFMPAKTGRLRSSKDENPEKAKFSS